MITNHRRKQMSIAGNNACMGGMRRTNYVCPECKFTAKAAYAKICPHCRIEMKNMGDVRRASKQGRKKHGHKIVSDLNKHWRFLKTRGIPGGLKKDKIL